MEQSSSILARSSGIGPSAGDAAQTGCAVSAGVAAGGEGDFARPPYLVPGDTVALIAPASRVEDVTVVARARKVLESWGLRVVCGNMGGGAAHPFFAGDDAERAAELQRAVDDPGVKAIIACRGGYGCVRLLPYVDLSALATHPKWIVGFSDITVLHLAMRRLRVESIHGPMPVTFDCAPDGTAGPSVMSLRRALFGESRRIDAAPHPMNRRGRACGRLAGGNLTLLAAAAGTAEALNAGGEQTILLIEDVGEAAYRIDRMMQQLMRSGALDNVAALLAGHFTDMTGLEAFGVTSIGEIIDDYARRLGVPAAYGFPAGHELPNEALYLGRRATVEITDGGTSLVFGE